MIETRVDEGPLDLARGAWNAGKGMFQAAKTGFSGAPVATGKLTKSGAAQMTGQGSKQFAKALAAKPVSQRAAYHTAKAVSANPIKTGLAATAAGAGLAYGLSGKPGETPPAVPGQTGTPVPSKKPTTTPPTPTPTPPGAGEDVKALAAEIDAIEKELMGSDGSAFQDDPEIQKAIADAKAAVAGGNVSAAAGGDAAKAPVGNLNAATAIPTGGLENPANQAAKKANDPLAADAISKNAQPKTESAEDELTRWLKIAHG
jgi:hypothetical protein